MTGNSERMVDRPWQGFWQVLYDRDEDYTQFRNTTLAVRETIGFVVFTKSNFLEIGAWEKRKVPQGWPPTDAEALEMFRPFYAHAGSCSWHENEGEWIAEQRITISSDPRLEGTIFQSRLRIVGETCRRESTLTQPKAHQQELHQELRMLSGPGTSPLAGAWQLQGEESWMYLVTAGHYGVIRAESRRPSKPANGDEFSDSELIAIWNGFGANAGARLETKRSFDHWPMIAQVAGYEVRKHETFKIESIDKNSHVSSFPPSGEPGEPWHRIE